MLKNPLSGTNEVIIEYLTEWGYTEEEAYIALNNAAEQDPQTLSSDDYTLEQLARWVNDTDKFWTHVDRPR
jgi:hypothetical protein